MLSKLFQKPSEDGLVQKLQETAKTFHDAQNGRHEGNMFDITTEHGKAYIKRMETGYQDAKSLLAKHYPESLQNEDVQQSIELAENAVPDAETLAENIEHLSASLASVNNQIAHKPISDPATTLQTKKHNLEIQITNTEHLLNTEEDHKPEQSEDYDFQPDEISGIEFQ